MAAIHHPYRKLSLPALDRLVSLGELAAVKKVSTNAQERVKDRDILPAQRGVYGKGRLIHRVSIQENHPPGAYTDIATAELSGDALHLRGFRQTFGRVVQKDVVLSADV